MTRGGLGTVSIQIHLVLNLRSTSGSWGGEDGSSGATAGSAGMRKPAAVFETRVAVGIWTWP